MSEEEEEKGQGQEGKREPGPDDSVEQQRPLARWNFQKKKQPFRGPHWKTKNGLSLLSFRRTSRLSVFNLSRIGIGECKVEKTANSERIIINQRASIASSTLFFTSR